MMLRSPDDLELGVGEKVLERAPQHHLIDAHDPRNRPARHRSLAAPARTPELWEGRIRDDEWPRSIINERTILGCQSTMDD